LSCAAAGMARTNAAAAAATQLNLDMVVFPLKWRGADPCGSAPLIAGRPAVWSDAATP
jgi:hypothetical protein